MSRVCVFGDSITWGSWDPIRGGWVGRLREQGCNRVDHSDPNFDSYTGVYNCGICGDKVSDVLRRIDVEAAAREPAVIVLAIGINDVPHADYGGTTAQEFAQRYEELIGKAKQYTKDICVVTPTNVDEHNTAHDYKNADTATLVATTKRCAATYNLPVIDVFNTLAAPDDFCEDGLHPNAAGHEKLYRAIAPVVFAMPILQGR